jgi:hypothetical protein
MSILKNALTRFRCFIGRHDTYLAEKWYFRSRTVCIRPCEHCPKVTTEILPPTRKLFHDA